jgi:hypothetical protein
MMLRLMQTLNVLILSARVSAQSKDATPSDPVRR